MAYSFSYMGMRLGGHSWSGRLENRAPHVRYGRAALPKGTGTLLLAVPKQHTKLAGSRVLQSAARSPCQPCLGIRASAWVSFAHSVPKPPWCTSVAFPSFS